MVLDSETNQDKAAVRVCVFAVCVCVCVCTKSITVILSVQGFGDEALFYRDGSAEPAQDVSEQVKTVIE